MKTVMYDALPLDKGWKNNPSHGKIFLQDGRIDMSSQVITMSTKGQIVLPSEMRAELKLKAGTKLIAFCDGDAIVLKPIELPSNEQLRKLLDEAQAWAQRNGITPADVEEQIKKTRGK